MARNKRRKENARVRERRMLGLAINSIVRSEPVIRVHDRRDRYNARRRKDAERRKQMLRAEFDRLNAPRRFVRKARHLALRSVLGDEGYHKFHNCRNEFRRLLSWRSSQGAGRKRTRRELENNRQYFLEKDC